MQDKQYDYKSLIQAYIAASYQPSAYIHTDFERFHKRKLEILEQAFGIEFDEAKPAALRMLFVSTVRAYKSVHNHWPSTEDSLLNKTLLQMGERGEAVYESSNGVSEKATEFKQACLEMLYRIFECMFGEVDKAVTSADLRVLGFDDSIEPNPQEYSDLL